MKRRHRGIKRRRVVCPECGYEFTDSYRAGVKRFQARLVGCPECDFTGRPGEFDRPGPLPLAEQN